MKKVGFLAPLTAWNDTLLDFLRVAPDGTSAAGAYFLTRGLGRTMAEFSLDRIVEALPAIQEAAQDLAVAGADVVAQFGIPFSLIHAERAPETQSRVAKVAGIPVMLMGAAMLDALDHLGIHRIAIAGGYYATGDWTSMARRGFESNGFDVIFRESRIEQGIVASVEESDRLAWEHDAAITKAPVLRTAERTGHSVDAIAVCGRGLRLLGHAAVLEAMTGLPMVAGDLALFWAILKTIGVKPRSTGWGRLLDGL